MRFFMRFFIKILLTLAMIVLPTISHAQTLKGGYWKAYPNGSKFVPNFKITSHHNKIGSAFSIACDPQKNILIFILVLDNENLGLLPNPLSSPDLIIDGKRIATPLNFSKIENEQLTQTAFRMQIIHEENIQLIENFSIAKKSIGIKFQNGFEYTVNAKGSTKAASVLIPCLNDE